MSGYGDLVAMASINGGFLAKYQRLRILKLKRPRAAVEWKPSWYLGRVVRRPILSTRVHCRNCVLGKEKLGLGQLSVGSKDHSQIPKMTISSNIQKQRLRFVI